MNHIENEFEFKSFMERFGPKDFESRRSYISRLNFISKTGFKIDISLLGLENDLIIDSLKKTATQRIQYNRQSDYPQLKSALNKYRKFLNSKLTIIEDIENIEKNTNLKETEKDQLIKARLGQGNFRKKLIEIWGNCAVSGIDNTEFLIASHILPWKNSNNIERLSPYNGLLLQPNFDKLFDKGFISFNDDGTIILSKKLSAKDFKNFGLSEKSKLSKIHPENIEYLKRHREIYNNILNDNN